MNLPSDSTFGAPARLSPPFRTPVSRRSLAAVTFALGWALFWAAALRLIPMLPLWPPLAIILSGLALLASDRRERS